jgi:hypothetical protein
MVEPVTEAAEDTMAEDILAGIEMLTIAVAEGIQYVGQDTSAARFNAVALEGNCLDTDTVGRFEEGDSDEDDATSTHAVIVDDENRLRGMMGDEYLRGLDGQYEWMVPENPNDIQRNFMGNDTLHRLDMKRMGLEVDGDGEDDADEDDDDDDPVEEDEDDEYDGEDNNNPLLGNVMFIEIINGKIRMHDDLKRCRDLLTNFAQRIYSCQSEAEMATLIRPQEHFFLSRKYDMWDRFYVRNFKAGMILSKVDAKTDLSHAMIMYCEMAKLHAIVYLLDHVAVRSRGGTEGDQYGTNNTVNSGIPVWMRILGAKSQWNTEELLFCRELLKRAPMSLRGSIPCATQFKELPQQLFLNPGKSIYEMTANDCYRSFIELWAKMTLLSGILGQRDQRTGARKAAICLQYYIETLRYRMSIITSSPHKADVLDNEMYRKKTDDYGDGVFLVSEAWIFRASTLYVVLTRFINTRFYVFGSHSRVVDGITEEWQDRPAILQDFVIGKLRYSIGSDKKTMETFSTKPLREATRITTPPGIEMMTTYGAIENSAQIWKKHAERKSREANLLSRYFRGIQDMFVYYGARFVSCISDAASQPEAMFDMFFENVMRCKAHDCEDFSKRVINDSGLFVREKIKFVGDHPNLILDYMFAANSLRDSLFIEALSRYLEITHQAPADMIKRHYVNFNKLFILDSNMVRTLVYSPTPYIVQMSPVTYDVIHGTAVHQCGSCIVTALAVWLSLVDSACAGRITIDDREYCITRVVREHIFADDGAKLLAAQTQARKENSKALAEMNDQDTYDPYGFAEYETKVRSEIAKRRKEARSAGHTRVKPGSVNSKGVASTLRSLVGLDSMYFDLSGSDSDDDIVAPPETQLGAGVMGSRSSGTMMSNGLLVRDKNVEKRLVDAVAHRRAMRQRTASHMEVEVSDEEDEIVPSHGKQHAEDAQPARKKQKTASESTSSSSGSGVGARARGYVSTFARGL